MLKTDDLKQQLIEYLSKRKKKLIISLLIFMTGLFLNVYFSTIIQFSITRRFNKLEIPSFLTCIESIVTDGNHFKLFTCINVLILIMAIFYFLANNKTYQSDLMQITPKIATPVAAGQNQFGSARWLSDKEKDIVFNSFILNPEDDQIKYLIEHGYDDVKKINTMKGGDDDESSR